MALVSVYADPDRELLRLSSDTLWLCRYSGPAGFAVIPIQSISTTVAIPPDRGTAHRSFVVDKMGLDIGFMAGVGENLDDDDIYGDE